MNEVRSGTSDPAPRASTDTDALLRRIVAAVENDRGRGWLELAIAVILSLATLATTWCGYQAGLWNSAQTTKQAEADTAERQAAEETIVGLQTRTIDLLMIRDAWVALRENDPHTRDTIFAHMRPVLRRAVDAAIAAGVLQNPELPGPLQRPEYVLPEEQSAERLRTEAAELNATARHAGSQGDRYVLLTLMFASVLFFGGITSTFTARRVRIGLGGVALALFCVTVAVLLGLPICKG